MSNRIQGLAGTASVLFCLAAAPALGQTVIYDATGGTENGGDSFVSAGPVLLDQVQNSVAGNSLTSVTLNVRLKALDTGSFDVVLTPVLKSGLPGKRTVIATVSDTTLTRAFKLITVTPTSTIDVPTGYVYFGIQHHPGVRSSVVLGNTVDPTVLSRPSVMAGGFYYNNGGVQANSGGPYEIKVVVTPSGKHSK